VPYDTASQNISVSLSPVKEGFFSSVVDTGEAPYRCKSTHVRVIDTGQTFLTGINNTGIACFVGAGRILSIRP
jgi:hypothetical protein